LRRDARRFFIRLAASYNPYRSTTDAVASDFTDPHIFLGKFCLIDILSASQDNKKPAWWLLERTEDGA
jgi:hypothetical protein